MLLSGVYNNMKKNITIILAIVLISSLMLTSCMNYKAYDVEDNANETDSYLDFSSFHRSQFIEASSATSKFRSFAMSSLLHGFTVGLYFL